MVIGPLNGGVKWPKAFDGARRDEREWLSYVRAFYKLLPGYRSSLKNAACLLIGSKDTLADIPKKYQKKCIYFPENGIDPTRFSEKSNPWRTGPLKAIFVGRLVPYKGVDMALEALAPLMHAKKVTLDIVGDGPMMNALRDLSGKLGIQNSVVFHGNVPHAAVSGLMAKANVLCFPSIREFGGGVVLEAMATGVVPIVVDYAGPGELVDESTGFKILLGDRSSIIEKLHAVISAILLSPDKLNSKSEACLARIESKFTWERKAEMINNIYHSVSSKNSLLNFNFY